MQYISEEELSKEMAKKREPVQVIPDKRLFDIAKDQYNRAKTFIAFLDGKYKPWKIFLII